MVASTAPGSKGKKRWAEREEAVCHRAEAGVVVEAAPRSPLEVVEAEFLLHLLVVALDAPAQLGRPDEVLERGAVRQCREPELGRFLLALWPCAGEPLQLARWMASTVPSGDADAHGGEAGGLPALEPSRQVTLVYAHRPSEFAISATVRGAPLASGASPGGQTMTDPARRRRSRARAP